MKKENAPKGADARKLYIQMLMLASDPVLVSLFTILACTLYLLGVLV